MVEEERDALNVEIGYADRLSDRPLQFHCFAGVQFGQISLSLELVPVAPGIQQPVLHHFSVGCMQGER